MLKVGKYYELSIDGERKIIFAVLYGFERGKNKDVYSIRIYTGDRDFEFPIGKELFEKWISEGRIKEITADEALSKIIG
ncbi:MAG: hypothetical protein FE034_00815 [Thermoplasmata archaeon]|nr:MAG: hypothetical protein FE034_00815 [Thermoplasmata archaeon]